uniref:ATP synthase F0 subunit 8 n=1 Tax=Xiphozele sp. QL-2014 TaxID=1491726 RepID=A0A0U1WEI7_9HYME|nr:ATP synthase F0 subunit 8 [Xiphozele sp. QL-2014]
MPQMSNLNWMMLMIYFLMIYLFMMNMMYFFFMNYTKKMKQMNMFKKFSLIWY